MKIKISGLKEYDDRHGRRRRYHRKSGTPIDPNLTGVELAAEIARLNKLHAPVKAKPGTFGGMLESYRASPRYTGLANRTKRDYAKIMDYLQPLDARPLVEMTPVFIAKLRDKTFTKKRAGFTNHMLAMLSAAFSHGREYGLVEANPVAGLAKVRIPKSRRQPRRPWSVAERNNVLAVAPAQLRAPLALARYLGMRLGDIVSTPLLAYRDGHLTWDANKNGKPLKIPVMGELRDILDEAIACYPEDAKVTMLCLNSFGGHWTEAGLEASMKKFFIRCIERDMASPGLTLHGLRHSVATDLRESGWTHEDIKDYLGQDTAAMAAHYSSNADVSGKLVDMATAVQGKARRESRDR